MKLSNALTGFLTAAICCMTLGSATAKNNTASTKPLVADSSKGTILLVISSTDSFELKDGRKLPTGYFLNELAIPAQALIAAGYKVEIANPKGNVPALDKNSANASWFNNDEAELKKALNFVHTYPGMLAPKKLAAIAAGNLSKYSAVFVPGGHPPMNDLMQDVNFGKILKHFHAEAKPTAFLCHGPVASLAALPDPVGYRKALVANDKDAITKLSKNWIYAGYEMTIFCNEEEKFAEDQFLKGQLQFYVADALEVAGGKVKRSDKNFEPLVVKDRELLTGENPASAYELAGEMIKMLSDRRR